MDYEDLSLNSPGRDGFTPIIEKDLKPDESKTTRSFEPRIPGPGEPGFQCDAQENILAGTNFIKNKTPKK